MPGCSRRAGLGWICLTCGCGLVAVASGFFLPHWLTGCLPPPLWYYGRTIACFIIGGPSSAEESAVSSNDRVVAVANLKGGVGKSTTVLNVAGFAAKAGRRVLMIDTDPQASLTQVTLREDARPTVTLADVLRSRAASLEGAIIPSVLPGVDLVPSSLSLESVLNQSLSLEGREYLLAEALDPHAAAYDLVLIDCRPAIDLSVTNALTAARWMLVPVECSFMALDGYEHVMALAERLRKRINPDLTLLGILPTRYRSGTGHSQEALKAIDGYVAQAQPALRFQPIRLAVAAADAPAYGQSLAQFAPTSAVGREYETVTGQILAWLDQEVWR